MANSPRYRTTLVPLNSGKHVKVYASPEVGRALNEVMRDMTLYKGVRLTQILGAVYEQGKKDGAHGVFGRMDELKREFPHNPPGRPRKR